MYVCMYVCMHVCMYIYIYIYGATPVLEKNAPRMAGQIKIFHVVPINSGNRSGSCSENCGFRIAHVVGCHAENGILNSESCPENIPKLSKSSENGRFTPRACFLKLGWSPGC